MSYFNIFPNIAYPYNDNGDRKIAKNILKRFTFKQFIKDNADLYVRYQMQSQDTFESLANKLYGSPDLHWILYLMNDIEDPYEDLPKTSQELTVYTAQKYPGYVLFFDLDSFGGDFVVGETVSGANGYTGYVLGWDGNMRQLQVGSESGSSSLVKDELLTGSTSGSTAKYQRRVQYISAVHHFEDLNGNKISSLPNPLVENDDSPLQAYLDQTEQAGTKIITNTEYEEDINTEKRKIKILRVEYRDQILAEAERIFK